MSHSNPLQIYVVNFSAIAYPYDMSDEKIQQGIKALRNKDNRTARRIFGQMVNVDPDNLSAWWYLAAAIDDPAQKAQCLRQVLRLHPDHEAATKELHKLERRVSQATPAKGIKRPILDAEFSDEGMFIISDDIIENDTHVDADSLTERASDRTTTVTAAATLIALIAITITVVLVWSGLASNVLGNRQPDLGPTARLLYFDVPACIAVEDETATLVFINNTGVTIELLGGPEGREEYLLTLAPDEQTGVDTRPGVPVRYVVQTSENGMTGSGAIIEVPASSNCRVPIQ